MKTGHVHCKRSRLYPVPGINADIPALVKYPKHHPDGEIAIIAPVPDQVARAKRVVHVELVIADHQLIAKAAHFSAAVADTSVLRIEEWYPRLSSVRLLGEEFNEVLEIANWLLQSPARTRIIRRIFSEMAKHFSFKSASCGSPGVLGPHAFAVAVVEALIGGPKFIR